MRRLPTEVKSQGEGGAARLGMRALAATKRSRLRRLTMESLEERALMAVDPASVVSSQLAITSHTTAGGQTPVNDSNPFVAINPLNPSMIVTVYGELNPNTNPTYQPHGVYSINAGTSFPKNLTISGDQGDPTNNGNPFTIYKAMGVAFDRNNHLYVGLLESNGGNAGTVVVDKYNVVGTNITFAGATNVYSWNQSVTGQNYQPAITSFTLNADSNLASFTDPITGLTQTDANTGNVYIAWLSTKPQDTTVTDPGYNPNPYNPNIIQILGSADGGNTWSAPQNMTQGYFGNAVSYSAIEMAISQGTASGSVTGGQVTVIWDDYNPNASADTIRSETANYNGGTFTLGGQTFVASTLVRGAATVPTSGVAPGAKIASDNSLGSFSQNEGALYVTYLNRANTTVPTTATGIYLAKSTNGGLSWTTVNTSVNDDLATVDGYSGSTGTNFRPKVEPSIAFDNATGTLALSWFDMRDDPTTTRYATYLATSIDGGTSFSKNVFANAPNSATDGITGKTVVTGPQSDISAEGSISFGSHQALAIANGTIYPVWSGTMTTLGGRKISDGFNGQQMGIDIAQATYATGPRIISSTMGPVGSQTIGRIAYNNVVAPDGTQEVTGFAVTFDRPVDISTFTAADVTVLYHDTATGLPSNFSLSPLSPGYTKIALDPTNPIQAADAGATFTGMATQFYIMFATPQSAVGTYSYSVGPNISDRIWTVKTVYTPTGAAKPFNAVAPQIPVAIPDYTGTDGIADSTITVSGFNPARVLAGVTVTIDVSHTYDSDLQIRLISPTGQIVTLSQNQGSSGDNYTNTTFNSNAITSISTGVAPFTGTFSPDGNLQALLGGAINGTWTLDIHDQAFFDTGTINSWSITVTPGVAATTTISNTMDQNANGKQDITGTTDTYSVPIPNGSASTPFIAPYDTTSLPIIIPGPHLVSSFATDLSSTTDAPVTGGAVTVPKNTTGTSTINLNNAYVITGITPTFTISGVANYTATLTFTPSDTSLTPTTVNLSTSNLNAPLTAFNGYVASGTFTLTLTNPASNSANLVLSAWSLALSHNSTDNLALNTTVNFIDVTFDRNMNPATFTAAQVLSMQGPIGPVSGPFTVTADPQVGENPSFPRTYRIGFPIQQISGTYTVTLGAGLKSQSGALVDTNENAGVSLLYGIQTGSSKTLTINGAPTSGAVSVTFTNPATNATLTVSIPYNATAAQVQTLLNPLYGAGNIVVTGGTLPATPLVFNTSGTLVNYSVPALIIGASTLNNLATATTSSGATTNVKYAQDTTKSYPLPDVPLNAATGAITAGSTVSSTITVNDSFNISATQLGLDITYLKDNDLSATLSFTPTANPANVITVTLFSGVGGLGANFTGTTFNDSPTSTPIASGVPPFSGSYNPANPLAAFNGQLAQGVFTLTVSNNGSGSGTLNAFSLVLTKASIVSIPVAPAAPAGSTSTITSTITVTDTAAIQSAQVGLSIVYPTDPNLTATLTFTPADTAINPITVTLFANVGNVGSAGNGQANFTNTLLSDAATTQIGNGSAPFTGLFNPASPLGVLNGLSAAGTYTLTVTNNSSTLTGTLTSFTLTLTKVANTNFSSGLGETVADQTPVSFRIFTMDPTNPVSSNTWTAVGGASNNSGGNAGRIGGVAIDPSDPSGNTAFIAGASGGVWVTHNFLTNDPAGPTYIPLTDAAATNGINIGSITVFGRNNDLRQSIVIVGTGEGDTYSGGVGFLISYNGGATWTLEDSLNNYTPAGVEIPGSQRDHAFVGMSTFKVIVDPHPTPTGDVVIYAAMTGGKGGVYRSLNSGKNWTLMRAGNATDVTFDPNSGKLDAFTNPTGNLRGIYGAFLSDGVYYSPNQGQTWALMAGGVGNPLVLNHNVTTNKNVPIPVSAPGGTPSGTSGRISIVHPALITEPDGSITAADAAQNLLYQGWLYALVSTPDGHYGGLYMTKDNGQNWVKVRTANGAGGATAGVTLGLTPTNNIASPDYDIFGGQGTYDMAINVDPNNPNVVYIGGSRDFGPATMIRVDVTHVSDAHSIISSPTTTSAGALQATTDPISIFDTTKIVGTQFAPDPLSHPYINLLPNGTTGSNTIIAFDAGTLSNSGAGATYTPLISFLGGQTDIHRIITMKDPISGKTRIIVGLDQGVFSGVDDGTGNVLTAIGTQTIQSGSRNGNIQITQFYDGAAQPSTLAAQISGSMFYGQAQDNGFPASAGNVLTTGNINWTGSTGDGTGVATDATGTGTLYQYNWPCCGGGSTDFFQVNGQGRTNGLIQTTSGPPSPLGGPQDPQWPSVAGYEFAVNPVNPNAIMLGSGAGRLFGTEDQGLHWFVLADPNIFDSTVINGLAYGAPDPNGPGTPGALDNYLIAGTAGGRIYVSFTGGGSVVGGNAWTNISNGLNGSSVQRIVTDPNRGSHDAYAITTNGVFYNADTSAANTSWQNITGNLYSLTTNPFNDVNQKQRLLNGLAGLAADWRYVVPFNPANPNGPTHPLLYVAGNGGTVRSTDNGQTWSVFPAAYQSAYTAPLNLTTTAGGNLPNVNVVDLDLSSGNVDPTTGRALAVDPVTGTPSGTNILLATTYGRGSFAIRLAPVVFNDATNKVALSTTLPAPLGSDTGKFNNDNITNQVQPVITGLSEQSAYGNQVAITLVDVTDPKNPFFIGGYNPSKPTTDGTFTNTANQTNTFGNFAVQVNAGAYDGTNHTTDGLRTVAIFATDAAGTQGTPAYLSFTLLTKPPGTPGAPLLETTSDSGPSNTDGYTNNNKPFFDVTPTVDNSIVLLFRKLASASTYPTTPIATANVPIGYTTVPVTGTSVGVTSGSATVSGVGTAFNTQLNVGQELIFASDPTKTLYTILSITSATSLKLTAPYAGVTNLATSAGLIDTAIQDAGPVPDGVYTYMTEIEDLAGNISQPSADSKQITIDTIAPLAPAAPILQPSSDSSNGQSVTNVTNPTFTISTGEAAPTTTNLYRGTLPDGSDAVIVSSITGIGSIQDTNNGNGPVPDGTYYYFAQQTDLAGNIGPRDAVGTKVTILTAIPGVPPTIALSPLDDSGIKGDNKTNVTQPHLFGVAPVPIPPGYSIDLVLVVSPGVTQTLTTIPDPSTGNYIVQFPTPLDGSGPNGQNYTVYVQVRDLAGNTLPSKQLTLTIKTGAPTTPPTLSILTTDDSGIVGDGKTTVRRPHLVGVTDPGNVVNILDANNNILATTTSSTFAQNGHPAGYYSMQLAANLSDGTIPLYAVATDVEGNSTPKPTTPSLNLVIYSLPYDYNGDGIADLSVYRWDPTVTTAGTWFIRPSGGTPYQVLRGQPGVDIPVAGDYTGAGQTLTAVFRPTTDTWYIGTPGSSTVIQLGTPGKSIPVPAAYDTTGRTEVATYDPATQQWNVLLNLSTPANPTSKLTATFGFSSTDYPVPGDYQGVGYAELGVYRPATGQWYVRDSVTSQPKLLATGIGGKTGDITVPGDYDGVGVTEPAVYRPSTGQFIIYNPATHVTGTRTVTYPNGYSFQPGDIPVPEDYDGDGKVDLAVYRPSTAYYFINSSKTGTASFAAQGFIGHDIPPQAPLPYLVNIINGATANIPGLPNTSSVVKPSIARASTSTSNALAIATTTSTAAVTTASTSTPTTATSTATANLVAKGNVPQTLPTKPVVTVGKSHHGKAKKAAPHHKAAAKPKFVFNHAKPAEQTAGTKQTAEDAAIESLADPFEGIFRS